MDISLSKEQLAIKKMITEFCNKEVQPYASEIDQLPRFPDREIKMLSKMGILGMSIPEEFGGTNLDAVSQTIIMEELSRVCSSTAVSMGAHTSLACYPLVNFASESLKEKYLPDLASGKKLGAFALTEPNAGSDSANQQTVAVKEGDEYVINGSKIFITNGGVCDMVNVVAMTDKSLGYKGISVFVVDPKTPGFSVGTKEDKLGLRGSNTSELVFRDLRIPKENLIGKEGMGFKVVMSTLDSGRIGIGAQGVGIAQAAMDESVKYSKQREQFGRAISKLQGLQFKLADMAMKVEAGRALCMQAACLKDSKKPYTKQAAIAKLFGSEIAMEVTRDAIQIHGGYGFIKDYAVERLYRDAKITEIYEGTSEIQRLVIAREMLK
ncbi:acyl-CoA dehydrogenase [Nanoarchaeota archaeon]